ncbi:F0F1 ATP synthase subunit epsilon [symbiont of Argiope bruennichi]|uniref:FoF1 ATP synthase subunit delta/epsilon n=1 Tax=symbiont of Argiope bruennichi TaxID=2810479 RepID=UPI003DA38578
MGFKLNIILPQKKYSFIVDLLVATTDNGIIGILSNHTPIYCYINISWMRLFQDGEENLWVINGGILTFEHNVCTITSEYVAPISQINYDKALQLEQESKLKYEQSKSKAEAINAQINLKIATNLLQGKKISK